MYDLQIDRILILKSALVFILKQDCSNGCNLKSFCLQKNDIILLKDNVASSDIICSSTTC